MDSLPESLPIPALNFSKTTFAYSKSNAKWKEWRVLSLFYSFWKQRETEKGWLLLPNFTNLSTTSWLNFCSQPKKLLRKNIRLSQGSIQELLLFSNIFSVKPIQDLSICSTKSSTSSKSLWSLSKTVQKPLGLFITFWKDFSSGLKKKEPPGKSCKNCWRKWSKSKISKKTMKMKKMTRSNSTKTRIKILKWRTR